LLIADTHKTQARRAFCPLFIAYANDQLAIEGRRILEASALPSSMRVIDKQRVTRQQSAGERLLQAPSVMKPTRIGRVLRAVRLHLRISQEAVATKAGVSQSVYSRAENGELGGMTLNSLDRIASALGATLIVDIRYRGGLGDRLVDAAHSALVELVVGVPERASWQIELEFGFNVSGERGSVDVLAWHPTTRTLLIVEVKSRFLDLQDMLVVLARKIRLGPDVVREERGWDPLHVARLVVTSASTENKSVMAKHPALFSTALPARALAIRRWLRSPQGPIAGGWLVSPEALGRRTGRR
jgi:transcriptional regulator with XRE-family HTH domain